MRLTSWHWALELGPKAFSYSQTMYYRDELKDEQRSASLSVRAPHPGDGPRVRGAGGLREFATNPGMQRPSYLHRPLGAQPEIKKIKKYSFVRHVH